MDTMLLIFLQVNIWRIYEDRIYFFFLMESRFFEKLIDTLLFLIKNNTNKFIV